MSVKYIQTGDAVDYTPVADVGAGACVKPRKVLLRAYLSRLWHRFSSGDSQVGNRWHKGLMG